MKLLHSAVAMLLVCVVSYAHAEVSMRDIFLLRNGCVGVNLEVSYAKEGAAHLRLEKDSIETTARSRLRGARIFNSDTYTHFFVSVHIADSSFFIEVSMNKFLSDDDNNVRLLATAWNRYSFGVHGNDRQGLLGIIGELTDEFIDEYLRVNEEVCQ